MKKPKKTGWVWWVVDGYSKDKYCYGPYESRNLALSKSNWKDRLVRKAVGQGKPEGYED